MQTAEELISLMRQWREYGDALRRLAESIRENPRPVYPPPAPAGLTGFEWWIAIRCDDCDCAEIETTIAGQLAVLRGLAAYTDFTQPLPAVTPFANAAGLRGEGYRNASNCIQRAIDEMESHWAGDLAALVAATIVGALQADISPSLRRQWRDNEIGRSRQFVEYLKAIYWLCCGEARYAGLLQRLASGRLLGAGSGATTDPAPHDPHSPDATVPQPGGRKHRQPGRRGQ